MKKILFVILALLIAQNCYAKNMKVVSGYGYLKDKTDHVMSKVRLSPGTYPLKDVGLDYVEVANAQELAAIQIYVEPVDPQPDLLKKRADILKILGLTQAELDKIHALP